jgi:branched-chain amino acid transport system ATP-binding protein
MANAAGSRWAFLLDEPMAGLGPEGSKSLIGLLNELRQEAPILLVEHDMDAVFALADRVSVLVYGRVIASGSVSEIRSNAEVRRAYFGEHV